MLAMIPLNFKECDPMYGGPLATLEPSHYITLHFFSSFDMHANICEVLSIPSRSSI